VIGGVGRSFWEVGSGVTRILPVVGLIMGFSCSDFDGWKGSQLQWGG